MKKLPPICPEQIAARKYKGWAFRNLPREWYEARKAEIRADFHSLPEVEFRRKYQLYIY